jgi:hypothetical protein
MPFYRMCGTLCHTKFRLFSSGFLTAILSEFSVAKCAKTDKNARELASSEDLRHSTLFGERFYILLTKWGRGGGWAGRGLGGVYRQAIP